jgi:hypothetical protein
MYELTIRAESPAELSGRVRALAAEFGAPPVVYESTPTTPLVPSPPAPPASRAEALAAAVNAPIPYEQVRTAVLRVAKKQGRAGVDALLAKFGAVTNAQEIAPERYPEVMAAAETMLAD